MNNNDSTTVASTDNTNNTPVAQTTTVQEPTAMPVAKAKVNAKKIALIGLAVFVPVALVLGTAAFAASNLGKDNAFSKLNNVLPTEKLPLFNKLGKSDDELLRDAILTSSNPEKMKDLNGYSTKSVVKFDAQVLDGDSGMNVDMNLNLTANAATNKDSSKAKADVAVGGRVKAGVIDMNLGSEGIKADILMPNQNTIYGSLKLSEDVLNTIKPALQQSGQLPNNIKIEDYLGKYFKLDYETLLKDLEKTGAFPAEISKVDLKKSNEASMKLYNSLRPDAEKLFSRTYGDFKRHSTITNEGRADVNGMKAIVLGVKLDGDKAADVTVDFVEGSIDLVKNHRQDLINYCVESQTATKEDCESSFDEEQLKEVKLTDSDKKEMRDGLKEAFKLVDFNNVKFYINPSDNTLLKYEATVAVNSNGLKEANKSNKGQEIKKLEFSMSAEETSRGKDLNIDEPKDAQDLNKLINDYVKQMEDSMKKLQDFQTVPSINSNDTMTDEEFQKEMERLQLEMEKELQNIQM